MKFSKQRICLRRKQEEIPRKVKEKGSLSEASLLQRKQHKLGAECQGQWGQCWEERKQIW